jgi:hypothetical protein
MVPRWKWESCNQRGGFLVRLFGDQGVLGDWMPNAAATRGRNWVAVDLGVGVREGYFLSCLT